MSPTSVAVVLSTYNGERYLPEFLASLAAQVRRPDRLVLRDDGSRDASPAIVADWARDQRIALQRVAGPPLGAAQSFLAALAAAEPADVTLLADQDDVWLPEKIARAAERLPDSAEAPPTLYASALRVVDAELRPMRDTARPRHLSFASAACESVLTGCTMAFNRALGELVRAGAPARVQMHDWWLYMLATATGDVVFDDHPTILYRQHGGNVIGTGPQGWRAFAARARRFGSGVAIRRSDQLAQLLALHAPDMRPEAVRLARTLARRHGSPAGRLRAALTAGVRRQADRALVTTRLAILTDRF